MTSPYYLSSGCRTIAFHFFRAPAGSKSKGVLTEPLKCPEVQSLLSPLRSKHPRQPSHRAHGDLANVSCHLKSFHSPPQTQMQKRARVAAVQSPLVPCPQLNNSQVPLICMFNENISVPTQKSHLHPPCRAPDCYINLPICPLLSHLILLLAN